jgi:hypothetical protein
VIDLVGWVIRRAEGGEETFRVVLLVGGVVVQGEALSAAAYIEEHSRLGIRAGGGEVPAELADAILEMEFRNKARIDAGEMEPEWLHLRNVTIGSATTFHLPLFAVRAAAIAGILSHAGA